jgi:hypothetical protein
MGSLAIGSVKFALRSALFGMELGAGLHFRETVERIGPSAIYSESASL